MHLQALLGHLAVKGHFILQGGHFEEERVVCEHAVGIAAHD